MDEKLDLNWVLFIHFLARRKSSNFLSHFRNQLFYLVLTLLVCIHWNSRMGLKSWHKVKSNSLKNDWLNAYYCFFSDYCFTCSLCSFPSNSKFLLQWPCQLEIENFNYFYWELSYLYMILLDEKRPQHRYTMMNHHLHLSLEYYFIHLFSMSYWSSSWACTCHLLTYWCHLIVRV